MLEWKLLNNLHLNHLSVIEFQASSKEILLEQI